MIAEIGAWSNPLSPDDATRAAALELLQARGSRSPTASGARCCVNLAGSRARHLGRARIPTTSAATRSR